MKLTELQQQLNELGSSEQNTAVLKLIDTKLELDMDRVLNEMKVFGAELKRVEDKIDTRFTMLTWGIGIIIALMVALKLFGNT